MKSRVRVKWRRLKFRVEQRILRNEPPFRLKDLRFAAYNRCPCGAGLAYPKSWRAEGGGPGGYWDCSAILMGAADMSVTHCAQYPFVFYEIKSEDQPSAQGATTRPV